MRLPSQILHMKQSQIIEIGKYVEFEKKQKNNLSGDHGPGI